MAQDRADRSFAANELSKAMASPSEADVVRSKIVIRYIYIYYIKGNVSVKSRFLWQARPDQLTVYSDSGWAGCAKSRKSTSGGVAMLGGHLIHHWSKRTLRPQARKPNLTL